LKQENPALEKEGQREYKSYGFHRDISICCTLCPLNPSAQTPASAEDLFYIHNYYAYANGIFLLFSLALILIDLSNRGGLGLAATLVAGERPHCHRRSGLVCSSCDADYRQGVNNP
jgi:hypothetical protein